MLKHIALIAALVPSLGIAQRVDPRDLPEPVARFCSAVLDGEIAGKNQRFNATDVLNGFPVRRIAGFLVSDTDTFLWYEHGGRGYHQHLVRFRNDQPDRILESYVLFESLRTPISEIVEDTKRYPTAKTEAL